MPKTEWQEMMGATMDLSAAQSALNHDPDKALRLLVPIEVVAKRWKKQDALSELSDMKKRIKRGHIKSALLHWPLLYGAFDRATRDRAKRRYSSMETQRMKRQISPKFKRAVEAEVGRLVRLHRESAKEAVLKADLIFDRDQHWTLVGLNSRFPGIVIQKTNWQHPPTVSRIRWGLDVLTEWASKQNGKYEKIEFGSGLRAQGMNRPILLD